MAASQHYEIILNQFAGSGRAQVVWPKLQQQLDHAKATYQVHETQYAGHANQLAQDILDHQSTQMILLIIGGDGTLHEALNGAAQRPDAKPVLAYIPCGSGNDFARGAGIDLEPTVALQHLLTQPQQHTLDIGFCENLENHNWCVFSNNIGIGFDAHVVHRTNLSASKRYLNKYHLGSFAYLASLIGAFFKQTAFPIQIQTPQTQTQFKRAFLVTTTNHPYFGGGVPIMPQATLDDGRLDLVVVERIPTLAFIGLFALMMLPGHLHTSFKAVHHFQAETLTITSATPQFGQADGEDLGKRAFHFKFGVRHQQFIF